MVLCDALVSGFVKFVTFVMWVVSGSQAVMNHRRRQKDDGDSKKKIPSLSCVNVCLDL
jgi:hypothetical protein